MKSALGAIDTAPYRLRARAWNLLATLAATLSPTLPSPHIAHPAVDKAQQLIELRLGSPISVADLAEEVDVSLSYLSKLFRKACDQTVAEYIVRRRAERAFHLIANSTMPIKAIAYSVGLPDLQQFNKAIRRSYGKSPRTIREMATAPR
jgi:transcriptional regulator GlxA family with amidase domain